MTISLIDESKFIGVGDAATRKAIKDEIERVLGLSVDFDAVDPSAQFAHGTRFTTTNYVGNNNRPLEVVYIEAAAALTAGQVCELPLIHGTDKYVVDTPLTKTNGALIADAQYERFAACVPLQTLADGEFGWAAVAGFVPILAAASAAKNKPLGLTGTAGVVDTDDNDYELDKCFLIETVGGAQAKSIVHVPYTLTIHRLAA